VTSRQARHPGPKAPESPGRASLERQARLSRLTGATLFGLAITAFWTLRLLGVL
jgi:hypothetical protein